MPQQRVGFLERARWTSDGSSNITFQIAERSWVLRIVAQSENQFDFRGMLLFFFLFLFVFFLSIFVPFGQLLMDSHQLLTPR